MRISVALLALFASLSVARFAGAEPVRKRTPINVQSEKLGTVVFAQLLAKVEETGELAGLKDEYVQLFNDALRKAGYSVPGGEKSVFSAETLPESDYVLAGAITGFDCADEEGVTCGLRVEWELLDRRADAVVYRTTAQHEEKHLRRLGGEQGARALLLGTLDALLARQRFVDALRGAAAAPAASSPAYEERSIKRCAVEPTKMPKGADRALEATVVVKVKGGVGSGVVISPDGFVLTAAHVATQDELEVRLRDGSLMKAEVVRLDEQRDVALLRLAEPARVKSCLTLSTETPKAGEEVYVLGSPAGEELSFSVSRGIVSGMRTFDGTSYLQTDAPINPGNSGGPLVGEDGRVLGIASWKVASEEMEGLGFAVSSSTSLSGLGIRLGDETDTIAAAALRTTRTDGAYVDAPDPNFWYVGADAPGKTPGWVRPVRGWGWFVAGLGGSTVLLTWLLDLGTTDPGTHATYRDINTVGWVALGVGAGMVVSSYVLKPKKLPPPESASLSYDRGPRPRVSGGIGPGSVALRVVF